MERNGIPADDQVENAVIVERLYKLSEVWVQHRTSSDETLIGLFRERRAASNMAGIASIRSRSYHREGRPSCTPSVWSPSSPTPASSDSDSDAQLLSSFHFHIRLPLVKKRYSFRRIPTTFPTIWKLFSLFLTCMGGMAGFSGWRTMPSGRKKIRLTVASSFRRATTMSPFSAVDWRRTRGLVAGADVGADHAVALHFQEERLVAVHPVLRDHRGPFEVLVRQEGWPAATRPRIGNSR